MKPELFVSPLMIIKWNQKFVSFKPPVRIIILYLLQQVRLGLAVNWSLSGGNTLLKMSWQKATHSWEGTIETWELEGRRSSPTNRGQTR